MKKNLIFLFAAVAGLSIQSCQKDDPIPETDQEETGTATLILTEVNVEPHGDHVHYEDFSGAHTDTIKFTQTGGKLLPSVGAHYHLDKGKTYRLELQSTDFAGRRSEQTFVARDDIHQVFFTANPATEINTFDYVYADKKEDGTAVNVGVTGYLTVLEASQTFTLRYVLRHLNPGVKASITGEDWNRTDFMNFAGATDLDLSVEMHFVDGHGGGH